MKKPLLVILCLTAISIVNSKGQEELLENYIQQGLESNLALQQKTTDYDKSLQALRSARGLFYPNVSVNARYTIARGGRKIEFPVGDMLNPVYSTLNYLTESEMFPMIENAEFAFFREKEHETKISLVQPVISPKIYHNYQIEKEKVTLQKTDIAIYKRELINEIKAAYYNFLKTVYLLRLVDETEDLLKENLRVSRSLFENDKVTQDVVYRSEAELQKVYLGKAEAIKGNQTAKAYFNFLLNKPLNEEIQVFEYDEVPELSLIPDYNSEVSKGINSREEIKQLETMSSINENYLKLVRSNNYPNILFAFDYGYQGEEYSFTGKDDFLLASVVLRWPLFEGFRNRAEVQLAKISQQQIELKQEELEKQIELQVISSYYELQEAAEAIEAAKIQVRASEKAFRVVNEKFLMGQSQLIEFTDARTTMTNSKQNLIIAVFEYKIREADLERVTADLLIN
jgi:outer membrane protein TolC